MKLNPTFTRDHKTRCGLYMYVHQSRTHIENWSLISNLWWQHFGVLSYFLSKLLPHVYITPKTNLNINYAQYHDMWKCKEIDRLSCVCNFNRPLNTKLTLSSTSWRQHLLYLYGTKMWWLLGNRTSIKQEVSCLFCKTPLFPFKRFVFLNLNSRSSKFN